MKRKILYVADSMELGGAQTHIYELCREMSARGNSVSLISSGGYYADRLAAIGIAAITARAMDLLSYMCALITHCRKNRVTLLHAHTRFGALACKLSLPFLPETVRFYTTAHLPFPKSGIKGALSFWGEGCIAVGEDIREHIGKVYSMPGERLFLCPNGIDTELFCPNGKEKKTKSTNILHISRLDRDRSACAKMLCELLPWLLDRSGKEITLMLVGDGDDAAAVRSAAARANASTGRLSVRFCGAKHSLLPYFERADIFVGVSRAALEAVSSALPCIICGNEGFFGHLTEKNFDLAAKDNFCARAELADAPKLAGACLELLQSDPEELKKEALRLRGLVQTRYGVGAMADAYENFYSCMERYGKSKELKIFCVNYAGCGNIADDACFEILCKKLIKKAQKEGKNLQIYTLFDKKSAKRFEGAVGGRARITPLGRQAPLSLLSACILCDGAVFGAGTLFQDRSSRRSLLYYLSIAALLALLGKSYCFWSSGISLPAKKADRKALAFVLGHSAGGGLRDERSLALCRRLIGREEAKKFTLCPDILLRCLFEKRPVQTIHTTHR